MLQEIRSKFWPKHLLLLYSNVWFAWSFGISFGSWPIHLKLLMPFEAVLQYRGRDRTYEPTNLRTYKPRALNRRHCHPSFIICDIPWFLDPYIRTYFQLSSLHWIKAVSSDPSLYLKNVFWGIVVQTRPLMKMRQDWWCSSFLSLCAIDQFI